MAGEDQVSFRLRIKSADDIGEGPISVGRPTQEGVDFHDPLSLKSLNSLHDVLSKTNSFHRLVVSLHLECDVFFCCCWNNSQPRLD